ncbi:hypothetical protein QPK24_02260 [Paenibacillus polygoni]|uniref:Uncharacterized protein n=1 Tax=Paenibacillus polygoni TaxID=3050112 RepID=A0ABY8X3J3_9BACL|nr:hypothetical protein [Paenibacillus polygoni]WIV19593.1 hypothetical protein QPK24_02260 [Paenibacillus polygoni]
MLIVGRNGVCRETGSDLSALTRSLEVAGSDLSVLMLHLFWLDVSRIEEVNGPAKAKSRYDLGMILFPGVTFV